MIAVMITMLIVSVLAAAALAAASDDAQLTGNDLAQKQAYLAAKSGIADYELHLNQDPNYWIGCPSPSGSGIGAPSASYAVSTINAGTTATACTSAPANPVATLIENNNASPAYGTFRIKSTGTALGGKVKRTVYATFQSRSFLDYVYYTKYETEDPSAYPSSDGNAPSQSCSTYYYNGRPLSNGTRDYCQSIWFNTGDSINGPMHSNDTLAICGTPTFGRNDGVHIDSVETSAPAPGYNVEGQSCTATPTFNAPGNKLATGVATIDPPPTNEQLKQVATSAYQFTGQTHITFVTTPQSGMYITNAAINSGAPQFYSYPSNGVIFVSSSTGSCSYNPTSVTYTTGATASGLPKWAYPGAAGCGTVSVDGTYNNSVTIASDNDIVIDGNLQYTANTNLLGLVAQNYVRVYHPCTGGTNQTNSVTQPNSMNNPTIDAAILSLTGSFMVDNYNCGATLGNLNVNGAIAQIYRGIVGIFGSTPHGYSKNYTYNDNLRSEEPPHFLEPIEATWRVVRETECNGTGC